MEKLFVFHCQYELNFRQFTAVSTWANFKLPVANNNINAYGPFDGELGCLMLSGSNEVVLFRFVGEPSMQDGSTIAWEVLDGRMTGNEFSAELIGGIFTYAEMRSALNVTKLCKVVNGGYAKSPFKPNICTPEQANALIAVAMSHVAPAANA